MSVFTISDLHLSLSSDKPMDIFRGWEDYVEKIKTNWLANVNSDDYIIIPGDISWALKLTETKKDLEFINNLPGKKIILKGNHDLWWESMKKMTEYFEREEFHSIKILHNNAYETEDFAIAGSRGWFFEETADKKIINREVGRLEASINEAKKFQKEIVVFLHYPPVTKENLDNEIFDVLKKHSIKKCYYGHIHKAGSHKIVSGEIDGVALRCVSCDVLGFIPLKIS